MKDSLIGINEGIEELILTLLIVIKADLLQFILDPDRLKFLNYIRLKQQSGLNIE